MERILIPLIFMLIGFAFGIATTLTFNFKIKKWKKKSEE